MESLRDANHILQVVQKGLSEYLETKRVTFPRLYFLSDDELLEILSQARNPLAVQPHLRKCFENIARVANFLVVFSLNINGIECIVDFRRRFENHSNVLGRRRVR